MPGILAIDPGTKTGFAFAEPGERPQWAHKNLGEVGYPGKIGAAFDAALKARIDAYHPEYITYEQPYIPNAHSRVPINFQTVFVLVGLAFHIDFVANTYGIPCNSVTTSAFVHYFTGRAKYPSREAKKRSTVEMCHRHGWVCTTDESDAVALLLYSESILYPDVQRRLAPTGELFAANA